MNYYYYCESHSNNLVCFRILVLSEGQVVEYDTPQALLEDPNSLFYGMAKDAGLI